MKTSLFFSCFLLSVVTTKAQNLVPDQNPNYLISQQKYMGIKDSLIAAENTTVQNTYKAYDWYQAKLEQKQARITNRQQVRLANAYANSYYYNNYNTGYSGYNYGYRNFNYYRPFIPSVGYRNANWWFRL